MIKNRLFLLATLLAVSLSSTAAHLVGGEIFYECLGGDEYLITLKVYRDCYTIEGAPFDSPAYIAVYDDDGDLVQNLPASFTGSEQLDVVLNDPCLQAPPDVCVEEAVYTVTATLPFLTGGYHIVYQRCCRNPTIVNLLNPDALGSTYYVQLPELALNSCNSSPSFNSFPPLALCTNEEFLFDHSATDVDGDLLVYSLCTPYHGGSQLTPAPNPPLAPPYNTVDWGGAYSGAYPIDANPALSIDAQTGELSGVPTAVGQYVVGVCVEEYRNGELISVNKRDFQFNVVSCESNLAAVIPIQEEYHEPCNGLEVSFGNVSVNAQYYHWDFGVSAVQNDTSNLENPVYTFPDTGMYQVTLIANPGYHCADTTVEVVSVYNQPSVQILSSGELCFDVNEIDFSAIGDFGSGATFFWEFEDAQPETSTLQNPQNIVFESAGEFDVNVTVQEHICSDEDESQVITYPRPVAYFNHENQGGCSPVGVLLLDSSFAATEYEMLWDLGDGTTSDGPHVLHTYTVPGFYDISLTITTFDGCIDTVTYLFENAVEVFPLPEGEAEVAPNTQLLTNAVFEFSGSEFQEETCQLQTGDGVLLEDTSANCTFQHTYLDTGSYKAVMIFTDENGCVHTDTITVVVEPEDRFWVPNAFTPNNDRVNDTWGPVLLGYKEYELWIYDRWGKLMFHTTDTSARWNGTFNNQGNHEPALGVYTYRIVAKSVKSTFIKESGHVTILK
ncbi:MAG: PKD domain-containing protein [Flavobacteriales bacterium]